MKSKSFTLIELLVVIVIIGILAGVIMISTSSSIDKANMAKAQAFSKTVQNELLLNLVSEWTFDISSNYGEDTWGNNEGTIHGTTPQLEENCVFGKCLSFNGTSTDYIECGNSSSLNQLSELTITGWFKLTDNANYQRLINNADVSAGTPQIGYELLYSSPTSEMVFQIRGTAGRSVRYAFTNFEKWVHIVAIYNGLNNKIYENGILMDYNNLNAGDFKNDRTFYIGTRQGAASQFANGIIDDIRIYDVALSFSQIKQNYIAGLDSLLSKGNISKQEYNERLSGLALE